MRHRPDGIDEQDVAAALARGWAIEAAALDYAPVGGGSYHWIATEAGAVSGTGTRWFVTADDLEDKAWLGDSAAAAFDGLQIAMDTAAALRDGAGLPFVLAPI